MKSGIVFAIDKDDAVVMLPGGRFLSVKAGPGWKKGDVVALPAARRLELKPLYAIAACLALATVLGVSGARLYRQPVSLVSIDVNPSVELVLNRFDRVVSVTAMNDEGKAIVEDINVKNKNYTDAFDAMIISPALSGYITDTSLIAFSVSSKSVQKEDKILTGLRKLADDDILMSHHSAQVEYYTVDQELVDDAHLYGVSPGKYLYLLKLQEISPDIDIKTYTHHGIHEIQEQIDACASAHTSSTSGHHGPSAHGHRR